MICRNMTTGRHDQRRGLLKVLTTREATYPRYARLTLAAAWIGLLTTVGGCSTQQVNAFVYSLGADYACHQGNESRADEALRDAECQARHTESYREFERYSEQRRDELETSS